MDSLGNYSTQVSRGSQKYVENRQQTLLITMFLSSSFQGHFQYKYTAHMNQYPPGNASAL